MAQINHQLKKWSGSFGRKYTDRNSFTPSGLGQLYKKQYGISRYDMNSMFLGGLNRSVRILEVGSNVGNQLRLLQKMGFKNLFGIEPQEYAIELSKKLTKGINIIKADAFDIPFKDGYFDLVFTSGVLIHIDPKHIKNALREIARCAKRYIWGFEYYSKKREQIDYRSEKGLLWKADFPDTYKSVIPGIKIVKKKFFPYKGKDNVDVMFLLKK